jgi:hypothetical protein
MNTPPFDPPYKAVEQTPGGMRVVESLVDGTTQTLSPDAGTLPWNMQTVRPKSLTKGGNGPPLSTPHAVKPPPPNANTSKQSSRNVFGCAICGKGRREAGRCEVGRRHAEMVRAAWCRREFVQPLVAGCLEAGDEDLWPALTICRLQR